MDEKWDLKNTDIEMRNIRVTRRCKRLSDNALGRL